MGNATEKAFASFGDVQDDHDEKLLESTDPVHIQNITPQYEGHETVTPTSGETGGNYIIDKFNFIFKLDVVDDIINKSVFECDRHTCVIEFDQRFSELVKFHQKLKANSKIRKIFDAQRNIISKQNFI